ncbi:MAG: hypothetical protein HC831_05185 [Chloroflexia bacterium]|nr:hypothetical protein [Chloroflexia bacterium]
MEKTDTKNITVECEVNAPVSKVWKYWTVPAHIMKWNNASEDWHTTKAENDLRTGGKFVSRMEAKDGSTGFDFEGTYDKIHLNELIEYTLADDRKVKILFTSIGEKTKIAETFETENMNSIELQRGGWQAILNNFKKYVEDSLLGNYEKIQFKTTIHAKVEKVFQIMFHETTYKEWTAVFNPTSHFKGSWEKGAKMLFLGTDQNGKQGGMVSRIKEFIPNQFVSIEHLGILEGDKEITSGEQVENWAGMHENYSFSETDGQTQVSVEMDMNEDFKNYFNETWPKALNKLKEICEA